MNHFVPEEIWSPRETLWTVFALILVTVVTVSVDHVIVESTRDRPDVDLGSIGGNEKIHLHENVMKCLVTLDAFHASVFVLVVRLVYSGPRLAVVLILVLAVVGLVF